MMGFAYFYRSSWFRPFTAVVVLALAAALGWLSVRYNPYLVLLVASVPVLMVGLDWCLRHSYWIPVMILVMATLTSLDLYRGITPALIVALVFIVVWLLRQLVVTRRSEFVQSPVTLPALALALTAVCSYIWSQMSGDPFLVFWDSFPMVQLGQLAIFVVSPLTLLLTASLITQARHLKSLVSIFFILMLIGGWAEFLRLPLRLNMRGMAYTWMVSLAFGQLLYNRTASLGWRGLWLTLIVIFFLVSFWRGITWLSGWLPGLLAIGVLAFFKSKKLFLVLLVLVIVSGLAANAWLSERFNDEYNESGSTRLYRWGTIFEQPFVWQHWVLGMGPAGYARYFMTYIPDNAMSTHSNYLDIFLQLGATGMVITVWLLAAITWVAFKFRTISSADSFVAAFAHSAIVFPLVIAFAMFLGDWFTPFVYNQGLVGFAWTINSWIFLGAVIAIPQIVAGEASHQAARGDGSARPVG